MNPADYARPAVDEMSATSPVNTNSLSTRRHFGVRSSKCPNRMLPIANIHPMMAMSIQMFIVRLRSARERLVEEVHVERGDDNRNRPRQHAHPARVDERSHFRRIARE